MKENIIVILAPGLFLAANRFFYCLGRLISHDIFSDPSVFLNLATLEEKNIQLTDIGA
jgi:hypothetical protein